MANKSRRAATEMPKARNMITLHAIQRVAGAHKPRKPRQEAKLNLRRELRDSRF